MRSAFPARAAAAERANHSWNGFGAAISVAPERLSSSMMLADDGGGAGVCVCGGGAVWAVESHQVSDFELSLHCTFFSTPPPTLKRQC